ncbi:anchored repeat ABC transporter, substrate-binding protein [Corynebacterium uterequi]|uniref:Anchored repeat ABC transporter, substrate-binding protein n=1 Tax=Corynebacterium uterequi TaxID=1072256 RepID=A0A0G3HH09_9CORY|nr:anchored repeat ABC transporter, substrate-binding protein [Corynebacterium uterequi]AKK12070.1 anchored repeat ABC transporter, substrate-binding protein [Corynebacterium uterequi]
MIRRLTAGAALIATATALASCASAADLPQRDDGITDVVTTTPIIYDLAKNVAGDRARVTSLMPPQADPHTYEPGLRDIRSVANADVVFANHLLLEDQALMGTVDNATLPQAKVVRIAENAEQYGATLIPLVEDVTLDTPWLGARVSGDLPADAPKDRRYVDLVATKVDGPGNLSAFVTGAFGQPQLQIDSSDGVNDRDLIRLPPNAHTHMSWGFTAPGRYQLHLDARVGEDTIASGVVDFAVGVDPGPNAVREGHYDIAIDLDALKLGVQGDAKSFATGAVEVPARTLQQIPPDPQYRFLGTRGNEVYLLPQAVLGKHVHGEIDPHLWHDADNARAYVRVIRDELSAADPAGAAEYQANAEAYLAKLAELDAFYQRTIDEIPPERRHLVTTHDGYGYLAKAYGLDVAGFVSPNPAVEPSTRDLIALTRTLEGLKVPAVFLEPQQAARPSTLSQLAGDLGVQICTIHGDMFTEDVTTYIDLMTANAQEIKDCLS